MRLFLLLFYILLAPLTAQTYPKLYNEISKELFTSIPAIEQLSKNKNLHEICSHYLKHVNNTLNLGYVLDEKPSKKASKVYLIKLRELQKALGYITRTQIEEMSKAMETNDVHSFYMLHSIILPHTYDDKAFKAKVETFLDTHPYQSVETKKVIPPTQMQSISTKQPKKICTKIAKEQLIHLGNPYKKLYKDDIYPRNIWDMQRFKQYIYLGSGNASNIGPSPNAGAVTVLKIDTNNSKITNAYHSSEEQISTFRVLNNNLYIPGRDATQSWQFGNYYRLHTNGSWQKYRNIPDAQYVYDIVYFDGRLFCALGSHHKAAVGISNKTHTHFATKALGDDIHEQAYTFLQLNDTLYITKTFTPVALRNQRHHHYYPVAEYNMHVAFNPRRDITIETMFPNTQLETMQYARIAKSEKFDNKAVYIGSYIREDGQEEPFGIYLCSSLEYADEDVKPIHLPEDTIPYDMIIRDEGLYILTYNTFKESISVFYASKSNPTLAKKILHFDASTFARSFEKSEHAFYFALGCRVSDNEDWDSNELSPECGEIIQINIRDIKPYLST